jgi:hypothetical protein
MQQVGGFVRVDSAVGQGTSFDLFFPIRGNRLQAAGDAWREIDQWANEGGAIVDNAPRPALSQ